ncbi:hypothetical protein DFP81_102389 [Marinomonas pollencensis]|uniref:Uncharacterized protein n=1 Tax=Marinomonas pollencensis TaxID=491954 RepID=A0A3E0DRU1_9GAMM|nr:hypothetical protein DFP81_102389 [Marinomonas pollencensis]
MRQMMSLGGFVFSLSEGAPYEGFMCIKKVYLKCCSNDSVLSALIL